MLYACIALSLFNYHIPTNSRTGYLYSVCKCGAFVCSVSVFAYIACVNTASIAP